MYQLSLVREHYWVDDLDPWVSGFSGNFGIRQFKHGAVPKG